MSLAERCDYILKAHCWMGVVGVRVYMKSSKGSSAHEFGGWKPREGGMFELQINFCRCRLFHVAIILWYIATNSDTQSFHRKLGTCIHQWENSTKQQLVAHMTHGGRTDDWVTKGCCTHFLALTSLPFLEICKIQWTCNLCTSKCAQIHYVVHTVYIRTYVDVDRNVHVHARVQQKCNQQDFNTQKRTLSRDKRAYSIERQCKDKVQRNACMGEAYISWMFWVWSEIVKSALLKC